MRFGFLHIIPAGLDHILFILGLFLLDPRWKPLIVKSLVFTLAHSLTLALALLGLVTLPERPVEVAIAASIVWIGIENLRGKQAGRVDLVVIGGFGLVHGLGFASQLAGIMPPDQATRLALALTGFNLGVEAGQIAVLLLAMGLFGRFRDRFSAIQRVGGAGIALAGLSWLVLRLA